MAEQATKEVETKAQPASTEQDQGVETTKADETAKPDAPKAETKEPVDYKAEYERVSKNLERAEHTIVDLKKSKKAPAQPEDNDADYTTAEEITRAAEERARAAAKAEWEEREAKLRADFRADVIAEELTALSSNPDEQKLIQFHYENTLKPTGVSRQAIKQDLARARLLANESRLTQENQELKEALKAKNSVGPATAATNQDKAQVEDEPKFSPQERAVLQRRAAAVGLSFKEYVRRNRSSLTT